MNDKKISNELEDESHCRPQNKNNISHVFKSSAVNLFLVSENRFHSDSFPDLNTQHDIDLNLPRNSKPNTVFQTNTGTIYVLYNVSFIAFI